MSAQIDVLDILNRTAREFVVGRTRLLRATTAFSESLLTDSFDFDRDASCKPPKNTSGA
jgi:hypothetical protein